MAKYKIRNFKKFLKQIFEAFVKIFCRKWEGETLQNYSSFLKMPKRTLSSDNLNLSFCSLTSLQLLMGIRTFAPRGKLPPD